MEQSTKRLQVGKVNSGVQQATAIGYDMAKDEAPRVLAKGKGLVAQKIIDLAKENDIPVMEDPVLVNALSMLEIDQVIPSELYSVVAEILVYVYKIQHKTSQIKAASK